jgi:hypothetical protein
LYQCVKGRQRTTRVFLHAGFSLASARLGSIAAVRIVNASGTYKIH